MSTATRATYQLPNHFQYWHNWTLKRMSLWLKESKYWTWNHMFILTWQRKYSLMLMVAVSHATSNILCGKLSISLLCKSTMKLGWTGFDTADWDIFQLVYKKWAIKNLQWTNKYCLKNLTTGEHTKQRSWCQSWGWWSLISMQGPTSITPADQ